MQVILTQNYPQLGQKGQSVSVKKGFYRNFLQPRQLAVVGTKKSLAQAEEINQRIKEEQIKLKQLSEQLRETLTKTTVTITEKLTKKGTLFAKVSSKEIAEAINKELKTTLTPAQITLSAPIKKIGTFEIKVKLAAGVTALTKVNIVGAEESAK